MSSTDTANELGWMAPGHVATPSKALVRIQFICEMHTDLFTALFTVVATHPNVQRAILASAVSRFRPDVSTYSQDDIVGMLNAIVNGGKQGFEAVLRTRKTAGRKVSPPSWISE